MTKSQPLDLIRYYDLDFLNASALEHIMLSMDNPKDKKWHLQKAISYLQQRESLKSKAYHQAQGLNVTDSMKYAIESLLRQGDSAYVIEKLKLELARIVCDDVSETKSRRLDYDL